jgi:hypothetical protein
MTLARVSRDTSSDRSCHTVGGQSDHIENLRDWQQRAAGESD